MRYLVLIVLVFFFDGYSQSNFGPPSDPTYGVVQSDIPQNYYEEANGKASDNLKEALHQIIQQ